MLHSLMAIQFEVHDFEYYGVSWHEIISNLQWYKSNMCVLTSLGRSMKASRFKPSSLESDLVPKSLNTKVMLNSANSVFRKRTLTDMARPEEQAPVTTRVRMMKTTG